MTTFTATVTPVRIIRMTYIFKLTPEKVTDCQINISKLKKNKTQSWEKSIFPINSAVNCRIKM